ncbi:MAG: Shedu immune nuclease family protein [Gemmatimonadota bacterium]
MDRLETSSTSSKSADCTPIVLRPGERTRLVFHPTLIENRDQPRACIKDAFHYEKKSAKGAWTPVATVSLATVNVGEQYKLELHSAELLALVEALGPLYRARWKEDGVPSGKSTYVKVQAGIARLLQLNEAELETLLSAHPAEAVGILGKLLRWLTRPDATSDLVKGLATLDPDRLPKIGALLGLTTLRAAVSLWDQNASNPSEAFWQQSLSQYSAVLGQLFAHPVVLIREKAYLSGKAIDDTGGSYVDILAAASSTEAVALLEIKTPATPLLGKEYRGNAFAVSAEVSGAIAQVLKHRHTLSTHFDALKGYQDRSLTLGGAPCIVGIGDAKRELTTPERRESFEAFRSQLSTVRLVTYDELFERVRVSTKLLEEITNVAA